MRVCVSVCVSVCMSERERKRAASREESCFTILATDIVVHSPLTMTDTKTRERKRERECVRVYVCERERERDEKIFLSLQMITKGGLNVLASHALILLFFFSQKNLMKLMR